MLLKNFFWISAFFGRFLTKKQPKKKKFCQNPHRLMKFSEIWYVDASQRRCFSTKHNATKFFFWISAFFGRFLTKKQPKLTKYEENWQNPNRLIKFAEIWYVDASQQKMLQKNLFWISVFFCHFLTKNQPKLTKNE